MGPSASPRSDGSGRLCRRHRRPFPSRAAAWRHWIAARPNASAGCRLMSAPSGRLSRRRSRLKKSVRGRPQSLGCGYSRLGDQARPHHSNRPRNTRRLVRPTDPRRSRRAPGTARSNAVVCHRQVHGSADDAPPLPGTCRCNCTRISSGRRLCWRCISARGARTIRSSRGRGPESISASSWIRRSRPMLACSRRGLSRSIGVTDSAPSVPVRP